MLPADYVREHVELGYASTAHRAQGRTVDTAHAYVTATTLREPLYVMATRGRESNRLYIDTAHEPDSATAHGDVEHDRAGRGPPEGHRHQRRRPRSPRSPPPRVGCRSVRAAGIRIRPTPLAGAGYPTLGWPLAILVNAVTPPFRTPVVASVSAGCSSSVHPYAYEVAKMNHAVAVSRRQALNDCLECTAAGGQHGPTFFASQASLRPLRVTEPTDGLSGLLSEARLAAFLGSNPAGERASDLSPDMQQLIRRTAEIYAASVSVQTRRDYGRRWQRFQTWCESEGEQSLPADPVVVMAFLADQNQSLALSTLRGLIAAIGRVHVEAGFPPPSRDPRMQMYLRGLRRSLWDGPPAAPVDALRIMELRRVCEALDGAMRDPVRVRDRCMLMLRLTGLSCTELARLRWSQISVNTEGVRIRIVGDDGMQRPRRRVRASDGSSADAAIREWKALTNKAQTDHCFIRVDVKGAVRQTPLRASEIDRRTTTLLRTLGGDGPISPSRIDGLLTGGPSQDLRDKALLLLGFAGAFRRNELTGLLWSNIRFCDEGLVVHLRRSKTDLSARGRFVGIPTGRSSVTCPVTALRAWQARFDGFWGGQLPADRPVFVSVSRAERLGSGPLTPEAVQPDCQARGHSCRTRGAMGRA